METKKLNSLEGRTGYSEKARIYVPSNVQGETVDNSYMVKHMQESLSLWFGGTTAYKGTGSYIMNDNSLVTESVTIIEVFTDSIDNEDIDYLIKQAELIKKDMKQEAVSLEINGKLYFI